MRPFCGATVNESLSEKTARLLVSYYEMRRYIYSVHHVRVQSSASRSSLPYPVHI